MEKNYKYAIRKTTLGVGSIAIAAFLAGQAPAVYAADKELTAIVGETLPPADKAEEKPIEPATTANLEDSIEPDASSILDHSEEEEMTEPAETITPYSTSAALEVSSVNTPSAQQATQESTDPNYAEDEKKIKDYSEEERYRSTQMEQGSGTVDSSTDPSMKSKDGFSYKTLEPAADSPDKKQWGIEIEFDKEKGQRTYTDFGFSQSDNLNDVLDIGSISANEVGDKLSDKGDFQDPNYKSESEIEITASGRALKNLNLYASEEDIKHINNINNKNTVMAWEGKYKKDNPYGPYATQGGNASFTFTVNPWPNENDKLNLIKLNGTHDKKEFVQGQTINTGVKVENLDANARERLVGQVYHPVTGEIVPGAKAYIDDDNDMVVIEMPKGAVDENGNINEDSIFYNDVDYKGLQNLEVKFFARPRTAAEFRAIIENDEDNYGTYTSTGAGEATINHKGTDVVIDKQGIDRYDHYNLIGGFKLNLDDTRYYDQSFFDDNDEDTSKHTSSAVKPGEEFNVDLYVPEDKKDKDLFPNQKTPKEMQDAKDAKQATASVDRSFLKKANEGKKPEDQWQLEFDESNPTSLKIIPPKSAKAGEFVAVPLTYTYTNGSTDVHWFHFVVQESDYIKPDYETQVNFPVKEQTSPATVKDDGKRITPDHYTLPDTLETDEAGNKLVTDDSGNKWTVTLDKTTGKVTAKPVNPDKFDGGEKLTVPVIAHYVDKQKPGEDITEEANAYFVIEEKANMTPRYNAKAGKSGDELSSDVILNEEDRYNRRPGKFTLDSKTYTDDKGNTWNVSIDEKTGKVTATVPNAEEGQSIDGALLNVPVTAHYYEEDEDDNQIEAGTKEVEVQFVSYGTNGKVEKTVEVPFETKVVKNPKLKKGEIKVITEGKKGSKKVTYTIEDSKIVKEEEQELEAPEVREIHVGEGVNDGTHTIEEKVEVPFETEIQFDDSLAPGEKKVTQEGEAGEKKRDVTLTIEDGNVTKTETGEFTETKAPKKRIIKVGRNTEGKVEHKEELPFKYEVEYVDDLKKGEYRIAKPGKVGTKTTTWTIKNSQIDGKPTETIDPAEDALIQVGKGTNDGTHEIVEKKELPFETRYEYDDSLEPGEEKVVQEGKPGLKERTNTLVIEDGKVTEVKEGEFKTITEPEERIIKIGRKPSDGETTKKVEREIPFETKVIYDENLEAGFQEIENEGKPGKEEVTITQKVKDSKPVGDPTETTKTITEKEDRVVRIGVKPVEKIVELGHDTEYRHNPELEAGETKVIEEGSKGSVKYTTTFNKETGKLEVQEERTEPKNKVVEYGSKTEGKVVVNSDIPFEVEIIEDPELEAGKTEVVQEGKLGEKETTITIENSKEVSREDKTITEPTKKIIKVGTKNVCEIPPVDPTDPTNPEDPKEPETPGEEDPKDPDKEDPDKDEPTIPGTPDKEEPVDPEVPGEDKPEIPEDPDKEEPIIPGTPDKDKPELPAIPETPEEPEVPETPRNPDVGSQEPPAEDTDSEEPGSPDKPETTPAEENPGNSGQDTSEETEETTPVVSESESHEAKEKDQVFAGTSDDDDPNGSNQAETQSAGLLPDTGETDPSLIFGASVTSILAGLGLVHSSRRKDEEN